MKTKPTSNYTSTHIMKQQVLLLVVLIGAYTFATAQAPQLAKVTPPSPNAAAFQKYGEIPVSPYTGIPDISIPVYTVQFRDITIPITLSYRFRNKSE
jgi:hypothetical protein